MVRHAHQRLRRLAAIIMGAVFFFSGVFKLMDPVGTGLIVDSYLDFLHLPFLSPLSKAGGLALALAESITGAALMLGVFKRLFACVSVALVAFFTVVTLILAVFNPAMDCGCFGEAIHLTHAQSLIKNLILCILAAVAFIPFHSFGKTRPRKWFTFPIVAFMLAGFAAMELLTIPLIDFTDYEPGAELLSSVEAVTADEPNGDFTAEFIYEKDGRRQSFPLDELPDSTWTFIEAVTERTGAASDIEGMISLPIYDADGQGRDSLAAAGKVFAVSAYKPSRLSDGRWKRIEATLDDAAEAGFTPLLLVAAAPDEFSPLTEGLPQETRASLTGRMYSSDYKTLISLNRSNGGATWFDDGQLTRKWAATKLPSATDLSEASEAIPIEAMIDYDTHGRTLFQAWLIAVFAIIILI